MISLFALIFISFWTFLLGSFHLSNASESELVSNGRDALSEIGLEGQREADDPESVFFIMDPVVTSASRFEQPGSDAPSHVVVITESMIRQRGYRNLVEVLKDLPGFDIQERIGGQAGGAYVIQRGLLGNNKIQIYKDGICLNPANGTHMIYGDHLSVDGLERIEVLYGPASAMYGADAFAGVINLVSKRVNQGLAVEGRASAGLNDTFEGYFLSGYGQADRFFQLYGHGHRTNDFDMRKEYDSDRYRLGGTSIPYYRRDWPFEAPAQSMDLMARAGLGPFLAEALYYHNRQPNNIQTPWITGRTQEKKDKVISDTWNLRLSHTFEQDSRLKFLSTLDYQHYELDPRSNYGRRTFDNYVYERSESFRFEEQFDLNYSGGKLVGGFSAKHVSTMPYLNSRTPFDGGDSFDDFPITRVELADGRTISISPIREQKYWYYGGFLQVSHELSRDLTLTLGGRYDWETFNHDDTFNPRVGLVYRIGTAESVKLMYARAYIFPSPYFRYKTWMDEQGDYAHLSPELFDMELDPERVESLELSYERHGRRLNLNLSLFWSQARDMIQETGRRIHGNTFYLLDGTVIPDGVIELPENSGMQTNWGAELSMLFRFLPELSIDLDYSFIYARVQLDGHEFDAPKVSNHKVAAGLSGVIFDTFSYSLRCRWMSGIHTQPSNPIYEGKTMPGAFIVDGNFRWLDLFPGADLELKVNNLLDHHYFTSGNGNEDPSNGTALPRIPQSPFQLYVGLSFRY